EVVAVGERLRVEELAGDRDDAALAVDREERVGAELDLDLLHDAAERLAPVVAALRRDLVLAVRAGERVAEAFVGRADEQLVEAAAGVDFYGIFDGFQIRRQQRVAARRVPAVELPHREEDDVEAHAHRDGEEHVPEPREEHHFASPPTWITSVS